MIRKKTFLYAIPVVFLMFVSLFFWLSGTNDGARFVLNKLVRYGQGAIEIGEVKGTLAGGLNVESVHVRSPDLEVSIRRVYLRWRPLTLFGGWFEIDKVQIDGIRVNDLQPDVVGLYDLTWPRTPGLLSWFKGRVMSVRVTEFHYSEAGRDVFSMNRFTSRVSWYQGTLGIENLSLSTPSWSAEGVASTSFDSPTLSLNGQVTIVEPVSGITGCRIDFRLSRERRIEAMSGPLHLTFLKGEDEKFKLISTISLSRGRILLAKLDARDTERPGVVTGEASLDLSKTERPFGVKLSAASLGISQDPDSAKTISGSVEVQGDRRGYRGFLKFTTTGKPRDEVAAEVSFEGDFDGIHKSTLKGTCLKGAVEGVARVSWDDKYAVSGSFNAKGLDPALITPDWPGRINVEIRADLAWPASGTTEGSLRVKLFDSEIRNKPLQGRADLKWIRGDLDVIAGELRGNGFDLTAQGPLRNKLTYQAKVTDMGGLIPEGKGKVSAGGWVRRGNGQWSGTLRGEGSAIRAGDTEVDLVMIDGHIGEKTKDDLHVRMRAQNVVKGSLHFGSPDIAVAGRIPDHEIRISLSWPNAGMSVRARGGYEEGKWSGTLDSFRGTDRYAGDFQSAKPVSLSISGEKVSLTPLVLTGGAGEIFEVGGNISFKPLGGIFSARWENIKLARVNPVRGYNELGGHFSGFVRLESPDRNRMKLTGKSSATVVISKEKSVVRMVPVCSLGWDGSGLRIEGRIDIDGGGMMEGRFTSSEPARMKTPDSGSLKVQWREVDVNSFNTWMPRGFAVRGKTSGSVQGKLVPGSRFEIAGGTTLESASLNWRRRGVFVRTAAEKADLEFTWKDSSLKGEADFRFSGNGRLQGAFNLPLRARFPVAANRSGNLDVTAKGNIQETGIINLFLPGIVEETAGRLSFELSQRGTWESHRTRGYLNLANATAYVPATGTRITEVASNIDIVDDRIEVRSFTARSGPGRLNGTGIFYIKGWSLERFRAKLGGERFQVVYLPELQLLANPDLTFEGDSRKIMVRGRIVLPEGVVRDREDKEVIRVSEDARVLDRPGRTQTPAGTSLDAEVSVQFGEKVRIAVEGLEGRLAGNVVLTAQSIDRINGKGIVRIVDSKFAGYGLKLDVARGNIILDGGPVEKAALDIMAVRTFNPGSFDQIRAGVTVTGTALEPFIRLYSEPSMSDSDILSYLLFGRPLRASGEADQTALLLKSAGVLFGGARGTGLQEQIRQKIGLDVLEVTEGPSGTYASSRTTPGGGLEQSLVMVGKYLSPKLYIAYGRSIFSDEYLVTARYSLGKRVEVETRAGTQTSVDLYYRLEFF